MIEHYPRWQKTTIKKRGYHVSINLLSYGSAQESIMRIESSNIANELIKSIESP